jgi:hypothetical protein
MAATAHDWDPQTSRSRNHYGMCLEYVYARNKHGSLVAVLIMVYVRALPLIGLACLPIHLPADSGWPGSAAIALLALRHEPHPLGGSRDFQVPEATPINVVLRRSTQLNIVKPLGQ